MNIDLEICRASAREAALRAWDEVAAFYRKADLAIYAKEGEGPATEADILADRMIQEVLKARFPESEFGYLTEETEKSAGRFEKEFCWIIDPIDGTKEFIEGREDFAIHVALAGGGENSQAMEPLVGVVYVPSAGILYSAARGMGAWAEDLGSGETRRLRVNEENELRQTRVVVTRSYITKRLSSILEFLPDSDVYRLGSLGVKVMEVAEGRADIYLNSSRQSCKEWDVCAPGAILEEAGGKLTDLAGRPILYNKPDFYMRNGLLASNGKLHEHLLTKIKEAGLSRPKTRGSGQAAGERERK